MNRECSFIQSHVLPSFIQHLQVSFQCNPFQTCWHIFFSFFSPVSLFSFVRPADSSLALLGFDSGCMKGNLTQILRKTSAFKHLPHLRPLHYLKPIESLYILMERRTTSEAQGSEVNLLRCPHPKPQHPTPSLFAP